MPVQWDDEPKVIWDDEVPAGTPVLWDDEPQNYVQKIAAEARHPSDPNSTPFFDRLAAGAARGFLGTGVTPEGESLGFDETEPKSFADIPLEALKRASNNIVGMPADIAMDQLRNIGAEGTKFIRGEQGLGRTAMQAIPFLGQGVKAISEASGRGDYAGIAGTAPAVWPGQAAYKSLVGKGMWKLAGKMLGKKSLAKQLEQEIGEAAFKMPAGYKIKSLKGASLVAKAEDAAIKEVEPIWRSVAMLPANTAFGGPFDASPLSRQLRLYTAGSPRKALAMAKNMAWMQGDEKISKALLARAERDLRKSEFFPMAEEYGLAGFRKRPIGASPMAENEMGVYLNPLLENAPEVIQGEFRRSSRSNEYALKYARFETFERLAKQEKAAGRLTPEVGQALVRDINNTTGFAVPQGNNPVSKGIAAGGNAMINGLSGILTSSRYTASRFMHPAILARIASPKTPMSLRKDLARQYLGYVASRASIIGLATASGWKFGTDPLSSEFMKLRHGDVVQDVFGGDTQAERLTYRLWGAFKGDPTRRKSKTGELVSESPMDVLAQFFSGVMNPAYGAVANRLRSNAGGMATEDMYGQKSDLGTAIAQGSTPAAFGMLQELGQSKDAGFLDALSGIAGNNVMSYEAPKELKPQDEKDASDLFNTNRQKKAVGETIDKENPEVKSLQEKLGASRKGLSREQMKAEVQGLMAQGKRREAIRKAYVWSYTEGRDKVTGKPGRLVDLDALLRGLEDNE